ncbi:MAG: ABC transporter ATP-binding protein [Lachnospirales bacterium]
MFQLQPKTYNWTYLLRLPFECQAVCTTIVVLQKLITGLVNVLWILVEASFIDTALRVAQGQAGIETAIPWLIYMILIIIWKRMGYSLGRVATRKLEIEAEAQMTAEAVKKRSRLHYSLIEDKESWELVNRVSGQIAKNTWYMLQWTCNFLNAAVKIIGTFLILFTRLWWMGLAMLAASAILILLSMKSGGKVYKAFQEAAVYQRRSDYLGEVLTSRESVNERALFRYTDHVNKEWCKQRDVMNRINLRAEKQKEIMIVRSGMLTNVISIALILLLSLGLTTGLTIGTFIALAKAIFELVIVMSGDVSRSIVIMTNSVAYLKDLTKFANMRETEGTNDLPAPISIPFATLEFRHVTFTYPGAEEPVLKDLSFRMEAGKHYAFVGENGAGKTTIIKLMTGLYDQYEGEILVNGRDLSTYTVPEVKTMFSGVYQDFAQYSISVADNIQLGSVRQMGTPEANQKMRQIAKKLDLQEEIESLPKQYDTQLGRLTPESVDLSGGQWQRLAMARSLMSTAPIQILDEPTAALDPISESRLYEQFGEISQGRTTIFISHRLGSTRLADEIFVLKDGGVLEAGTHQELMTQQGLYAKMYESQRSWYQE